MVPKKLKNIVFGGVTIVGTVGLTLVSVEFALRTLVPSSTIHLVLPPDYQVTSYPLSDIMRGVTGAARYGTNSVGIRGEEFSDTDDYRILAIGGSTTQNMYLDQTETWTLQVGSRLNARAPTVDTWTGDVGRSGHTVRSHVLQFDALTRDLPSIDAVVMLVGVNDLTSALRRGYRQKSTPPLSDPAARSAQVDQAFIQLPGRLHERRTLYRAPGTPFFKRTALYEILRSARDRLVQLRGGERQDAFGNATEIWRENRARAGRLHDSLPDLSEALTAYDGYLAEIITTARRRRVRLILMTQPSFWRGDLSPREDSLLWSGGIGDFQAHPGSEYFTPGALRRAMDLFNQRTLSVCRRESVECLDLAAEIPADTTHFYDDVHFTEMGAAAVAETLAEYLLAKPPYVPAAN